MSAADVLSGGSRWSIEHADCLDVLRSLPPLCVDAVVTDPPAAIKFMGADWDGDRGGRDKWVAWLAEVFAELRRVAKPGAHALVWALPRRSHWTGMAIENGGWLIGDRVSHLFGQGRPSGAAAAEGWNTRLKPGMEDWWLARTPLDGTLAHNFGKWGTGALNIDGCRIFTDWNEPDRPESWKRSGHSAKPDAEKIAAPPGVGIECHPLGRWPANVEFSHDEECLETDGARDCSPECPVRMLDEQSGLLKAGKAIRHRSGGKTFGTNRPKPPMPDMGYGDSGGASRFFYVAKASRRERNLGLGDEGNPHKTVKPKELMRRHCRMVTPPGGIILDPFCGSGTTVLAAVSEGFRAIGVDLKAEYVQAARARVEAHCPTLEEPLTLFGGAA